MGGLASRLIPLEGEGDHSGWPPSAESFNSRPLFPDLGPQFSWLNNHLTQAVIAAIIVIAFCGTFSHYCLTRAMLHADATVVVPMDFLRVPLAALAGWLLYGERLDTLTILGAALILSGNLLNLKGTGARRR